MLTVLIFGLSFISGNVHRNIAITSHRKYYLDDESHRFNYRLSILGDITLGFVWNNLVLQLMSPIYDAGLRRTISPATSPQANQISDVFLPLHTLQDARVRLSLRHTKQTTR